MMLNTTRHRRTWGMFVAFDCYDAADGDARRQRPYRGPVGFVGLGGKSEKRDRTGKIDHVHRVARHENPFCRVTARDEHVGQNLFLTLGAWPPAGALEFRARIGIGRKFAYRTWRQGAG